MKDSTNIEIKIAIVIAIIMATVILVAIIFTKEETATNTIDLHIYKLYEVEGSNDQHVYRECNITTDDVIKLYGEYRKIKNLPDSYKKNGESINGDYKIVSGNDYIAFDAKNEGRVYRSDSTAIYGYNSSIYESAVELCSISEQREREKAQSQEQSQKVEKEVKK